MGIFSWFSKDDEKKRRGNSFEDPELAKMAAERAEEMRRLKHEQRTLEYRRNILREKARVQELQQEIAMYEAPPMPEQPQNHQMNDIMGLMMLMQAFSGKAQPGQDDMASFMEAVYNGSIGAPSQQLNQNAPQMSSPQSPRAVEASEIELSDEDIRATLSTIPRDKRDFAKNLPPMIIKKYIKKNFDYDDKTIDRAIQILKTEM